MKKLPLRIVAGLMLVISLLTLSGLTATAGTLLETAQSKSCCAADSQDTTGAPAAGHCSTPDCPCFACISMILSPIVTLQRSWVGEPLSPISPVAYQLSAYVRSIEYPPENA
ncbi:MAG TPA: hypothetical protein DCZ75_15000 [Geobacter sp.]|nr:hypothetical protein [Geobacter sp.]